MAPATHDGIEQILEALIAVTAVLYRAAELQTYDPILREVGTKGWPILGTLAIDSPEDAPAGPLFSTD